MVGQSTLEISKIFSKVFLDVGGPFPTREVFVCRATINRATVWIKKVGSTVRFK